MKQSSSQSLREPSDDDGLHSDDWIKDAAKVGDVQDDLSIRNKSDNDTALEQLDESHREISNESSDRITDPEGSVIDSINNHEAINSSKSESNVLKSEEIIEIHPIDSNKVNCSLRRISREKVTDKNDSREEMEEVVNRVQLVNRSSLLDELNVGSMGHVTHLAASSAFSVASKLTNGTSINSTDGMAANETGSVPSEGHESECLTVLFYFDWCPFSQAAAPAYNALARAFPSLNVWAIDTHSKNSINMRFGLVGVPSVLFFHRGRMIAKYNGTTVSLDGLTSFVSRVSNLRPVDGVEVTDEDLVGPVPGLHGSRTSFNYVLAFAVLFLTSVSGFFLVHSPLWTRLKEAVHRTWREAGEAQHEHAE